MMSPSKLNLEKDHLWMLVLDLGLWLKEESIVPKVHQDYKIG